MAGTGLGLLGLGDARQCRALGQGGGDFGGDGFGLAAREVADGAITTLPAA